MRDLWRSRRVVTMTLLVGLTACGDTADPTPVGPPPAPGPVATVALDVGAVALEEGATRQLVATPRDAAGRPIPGLAVEWRAGDSTVAAIDGQGRVTAVRAGSTTVTARVSGRQAEATLTVSASYDFDLLFDVGETDDQHALLRLDLGQPAAAPGRLFAGAAPASQAAVSPDGTRIAFICPNPIMGDPALCLADRTGGNRRVLAWDLGGVYARPSWSPDGARLAFMSAGYQRGTVPEPTPRIGVVNADGTGLVLLTNDLPGVQRTPAWSPRLADGSEWIAFSHEPAATPGTMHLWVMRPDGSGKRALTTGSDVQEVDPAWSPDGATIAYQRSAPGVTADIWRVSMSGEPPRALTAPLPGLQGAPAWSPDGRLLAFVSAHEARAEVDAPYQVYTVWADGSKLARRTSDSTSKRRPTWLPRR
jgi:Tol biopolymer transport system component